MSREDEMAYVIGRSSYGSRPWFAVASGGDVHEMNAVWLFSGVTSIETQGGTITTDGYVRFFARKRDALTAIARTKARKSTV